MAKLTEQDKKDIIRRNKAGVAFAVLAQDFKVSEQTCRNVVKAGASEPEAGEDFNLRQVIREIVAESAAHMDREEVKRVVREVLQEMLK